jgi:hypothetical protein
VTDAGGLQTGSANRHYSTTEIVYTLSSGAAAVKLYHHRLRVPTSSSVLKKTTSPSPSCFAAELYILAQEELWAYCLMEVVLGSRAASPFFVNARNLVVLLVAKAPGRPKLQEAHEVLPTQNNMRADVKHQLEVKCFQCLTERSRTSLSLLHPRCFHKLVWRHNRNNNSES